MTHIVTALIRCYQRTFSPDHGWFRGQHPLGFCRFAPTCSQYAIVAMEQFGFFRGAALATWRVLRCNPFARGGLDPVPPHPDGGGSTRPLLHEPARQRSSTGSHSWYSPCVGKAKEAEGPPPPPFGRWDQATPKVTP